MGGAVETCYSRLAGWGELESPKARRGRSRGLLILTVASPVFFFTLFRAPSSPSQSLSPLWRQWRSFLTTLVLTICSLYLEQKFDPAGQQTCSAHPARFSPDDKYSRHRITIKKRFKVLMTQQPRPVLWGSLKFHVSCRLLPLCALKPYYHPCSLESGVIITFDHACERQSWYLP